MPPCKTVWPAKYSACARHTLRLLGWMAVLAILFLAGTARPRAGTASRSANVWKFAFCRLLDRRADAAHRQRSPDGAQRNPGLIEPRIPVFSCAAHSLPYSGNLNSRLFLLEQQTS